MSLSPDWKNRIDSLVRDTIKPALAEDLNLDGSYTKEEAMDVISYFQTQVMKLTFRDIRWQDHPRDPEPHDI